MILYGELFPAKEELFLCLLNKKVSVAVLNIYKCRIIKYIQ